MSTMNSSVKPRNSEDTHRHAKKEILNEKEADLHTTQNNKKQKKVGRSRGKSASNGMRKEIMIPCQYAPLAISICKYCF